MAAFRELLGLPLEQSNAPFEPDAGFVMRVGIPHRGGRLAFQAFEHAYPAMVSASAFWNPQRQCFCVPEMSNLWEVDFALDSAGFTAMRAWKAKGRQGGMAGLFPWSYAQYVELAALVRPSWWAQPDLCCEPEIAENCAEVDYRVRATATLLEGVLRILYEWQNQLARTCNARTVASMLTPPVPVLQGWAPSDYVKSLDLLMHVWNRWQPWIGPPRLIGLGSVCRRSLNDQRHGLLAILGTLEGRLPRGSRLHLFGVKGDALSHTRTRPWIASADSMAYDAAARRKAWSLRTSNSFAHRGGEMVRWMSGAHKRMAPRAGDQLRLCLRMDGAETEEIGAAVA